MIVITAISWPAGKLGNSDQAASPIVAVEKPRPTRCACTPLPSRPSPGLLSRGWGWSIARSVLRVFSADSGAGLTECERAADLTATGRVATVYRQSKKPHQGTPGKTHVN